jgi:hypothetical protein
MIPPMSSYAPASPRPVPAPPPGRAETSTAHDQAARGARFRRTAAEVDRVRTLARTHTGDPDWNDVVALLDRLSLALGRDLDFRASPDDEHVVVRGQVYRALP